MPGPGSVHMADADDIIEILSSEEGGGSDEEAGSMSEGGSEDYNYSTDEDASGDLGEEDPRPMSVSEKKLPYRIIDSEALKQVQVSPYLARAPLSSRCRCLCCAAATAPAPVLLQLVPALKDFCRNVAPHVYVYAPAG